MACQLNKQLIHRNLFLYDVAMFVLLQSERSNQCEEKRFGSLRLFCEDTQFFQQLLLIFLAEKAPLSLHPDALTSSWRVIPIPLVARAVTTAIWSADYANRGSFAQPIGKPRADLSISGNSAKSLFILSSISLLET